MKKLILTLVAPLMIGGCLSFESRVDRLVHGRNPYLEAPFYARYLSADSPLDRRIQQTLDGLKANPRDAALHNDLGSLLLEKGFPKDAEREFHRAVAADDELYAAWYNLGLIRESRGDFSGATDAYQRTLDLKPGHPAAHFQMGLMLEGRGRDEAAIEHYARAFAINRAMLDVRVNPRILDTKLIDRALLRNYEKAHSQGSMHFQATPTGYTTPAPVAPPRPEATTAQPTETNRAPSPQPTPRSIVTPSAPATDPSQQPQLSTRPAPEERPMTRQERYRAALERERANQPSQLPPPAPNPPGFEILPDATGTPR